MTPDCAMCGDTGWITCVEADGEGAYFMACPEGCLPLTNAPTDQEMHLEVPF